MKLPSSSAGSGSLRRRGSVYVLSDTVERTIGFLMLPAYIYGMSPGDFGITALVQTFVGLGSAVLGLGLYATITRYYFNPPEGTTGREMIGAAWGLLLVVPLVVLGLLGTAGHWLLTAMFSSLDFWPFIVLALVTTYCTIAFVEPALAVARTFTRPGKYALIQLSRVGITSALVLWLVVGRRDGALGAVQAQAAASVVVAVFCAGWLWRQARPRFVPGHTLALARFGLALVPLDGSTWALRMQDRVLLDKYHVPLSGIGAYALSYKLASPLQLLMTSARQVLMPVLSAAAKHEQLSERARRALCQYLAGCLAIALFGTVAVGEVARAVLPKGYADAATLAQLVIPATFAYGIFQLAATASTQYAGRPLQPLPLTIGAALTNVVLNLVLIPESGATGAAVATAVSYALLAVAAVMRSPLPELIGRALGPLGVVTLSAGAVAVLGVTVLPQTLWVVVLFGAGAALLHGGVAYRWMLRAMAASASPPPSALVGA